MAGGPRFELIAGRRRQGISVPMWPGYEAADSPDGPWCAWRLLGGNNRDLGRSAQVFPDPLECRAAVERVRRHAADLVPVVVAEAGTGMWSWRLELDGVPVAVAARPYHRQREGKYNLTRFLSALDDAALSELGPTTRRVERAAVTRSGRMGDRLA